MANHKIYNQKAEEVGTIRLSNDVFAVKPNKDLVYQAVVAQMANQRQVLAHTKDRSEVRGGGKKPWRQKGTGRARAGSSRSPIWIGGGVTFGPTKERNFKKDLNKKMKKKALLTVLSDKVIHNNLFILDKIETKEYKTKFFDEMLKGFEKKIFISEENVKASKKEKADKGEKGKKEKRSILIILDKKEKMISYSARNLVGVKLINLNNINIVDLLKYKNIIFTKVGVKEIEEKYKK